MTIKTKFEKFQLHQVHGQAITNVNIVDVSGHDGDMDLIYIHTKT